MMIPLSQIECVGYGSWGLCNIYANMLRQGKRAPAVVLTKHGDKYRVVDGEHRIEALRILHQKRVKAVIIRGRKQMTETNGHYAAPDLDRIIHGLHLRMAGLTSELAEKDRSDKAQTKMMLETIGKYIDHHLKPLRKQIEELKTQVDELKRKGISYKGVYQKSCEYAVGDMVSYDHSVWCCIQLAQAGESPGAFPSQWQMALRGDGRDIARQPTRGRATRRDSGAEANMTAPKETSTRWCSD